MSTVLVTGANRGLGLEFARQYSEAGWVVHACCRSASPELEAVAAAHPDTQIHSLDVADHSAVEALAAELAGQAVDVLINNAGIYGAVSFADGGVEHQAFGNTDYADWERVLRVNLLGPMKMIESFIDNVAASEQKKIVSLSSMLGSMGLNDIGGMYAYRTSKAALNMLMHSLAIDLAGRGVSAVAVHPGWARTEMGGPDAEVDPADGVAGLIRVIEGLTPVDTGKLIGYDGSVLPY